MSTSGAFGRCISRNVSSSQRSVNPWRSASRLERWMVMPSAIGSVNGTPISTTSAAAPICVSCSRNFSRLG